MPSLRISRHSVSNTSPLDHHLHPLLIPYQLTDKPGGTLVFYPLLFFLQMLSDIIRVSLPFSLLNIFFFARIYTQPL